MDVLGTCLKSSNFEVECQEQEYCCKFEASLGCITKPCIKTKQNNKKLEGTKSLADFCPLGNAFCVTNKKCQLWDCGILESLVKQRRESDWAQLSSRGKKCHSFSRPCLCSSPHHSPGQDHNCEGSVMTQFVFCDDVLNLPSRTQTSLVDFFFFFWMQFFSSQAFTYLAECFYLS